MPKRTRIYVASHEAGHACAATLLEAPFERVYINDPLPEVGEGGAVVYKPMTFHPIFDCRAEVIRKMAGEAGLRLYAGRKPGRITTRDLFCSGVQGDYLSAIADAKDMAARILNGKLYPSYLNDFFAGDEFLTDKFIHDCYQQAFDILVENQKFHERVTHALIRKGDLTFDEVSELNQ
jgi:ATP-dependent Zn protease